MEKNKKNLKFAIRQIINATWVLKYEIPDDDINKARQIVGAEPEIIIREHIRDDRYYHKTNKCFTIEEDADRNALVVIVEYKSNTPRFSIDANILKTERYPVRNRKNIFEYNYDAPIDKILEKHRRIVEA